MVQFFFQLDDPVMLSQPLLSPNEYKIVQDGNGFQVVAKFGCIEKAMAAFTNAVVPIQ